MRRWIRIDEWREWDRRPRVAHEVARELLLARGRLGFASVKPKYVGLFTPLKLKTNIGVRETCR